MDYTVILNLILELTIIIITRISLKINNTNNNLLQQINLLEKRFLMSFLEIVMIILLINVNYVKK